MGCFKYLTKNILIFSYIFLFSSTQLFGWGIPTPGRIIDAPWNPPPQQQSQAQQDENITQNNLKKDSIVTIKVKGKYLNADQSKVASGGKVELKLRSNLASINQLFLVNKTDNGEFVGFRPMINSTRADNYLEFKTNTKDPFISGNTDFNDWQLFKLDPIEGKTDTYYVEYKATDDNVMQLGDTLKAGYAATDVVGKQSAQFEIKEFTLNNPAAKTILNPSFYRPDLVTIRNVGQNKYISSSHETGSMGGTSQKVIAVDKPISPLSVFKVALQERVRNKNTKAWPDYKTKFEQEEKWLSLISTNRLGFSAGSPRTILDLALSGNNAYFNPDMPANACSDLAFYKVYTGNKYIIKNHEHGKFLRLLSSGKLIADVNRAAAIANKNCLFEIKRFHLNPDLRVLYGRTELSDQFKLPRAGDGYLKFQVKAWRDFRLSLFNENKELIGNILFNNEKVEGTIKTERGDEVLKVINPNFKLNVDTDIPFWLLIKNNKLKIGTGTTVGQNAFNFEFGPGRTGSELTSTKLNQVVYFQFEGYSEYGQKNRQTIIAKIESKEPDMKIPGPPRPFGRDRIVKLRPGFYKIKNVETKKYVTILNKNLNQDIYPKWNIYSLQMQNKSTAPTQIFKISETNGWHSIIGSVDATYETPNSGMFDTGYGTVYFNKSLKTSNYRRIKITGSGSVLGYEITSEKDKNSRYGVQGDKLIRDATNSRFIFEPTTAPTDVYRDPSRIGRTKTIKLKPGYYKIKNVETKKYVTIIDKNLDKNIYNWDMFSLRMQDKTNKPVQVFKISEKDGWHTIIGSVDATYKTPNSGMFDTGKNLAYFNKSLKTSTYRKIKITGSGSVLGYEITSEKDKNSRYGVQDDKLIKDAKNSRFIFEPTTAPTAVAISDVKPPKPGLKVEGIDLALKKIVGGLTQVSVGGSLICGINKDGNLYNWNNSKTTWDKFSDAKFKYVSVGSDNTVLALGTNKKIYTKKDGEWKFFDRVIFGQIQRTSGRIDVKPGELPSPDQISGLPIPGALPQKRIPGSIRLRTDGQSIPMKQVSIGSREYIWALGEDGKAYKWDGLNWIDNSKGMTFSDISVGMDGTVKALDQTKKVANWTGSSWTISPFKLHQISVINKNKHWAISKEDDGSYNVYKFVDGGYVLRAKNLQQMSANNEGTIFGISTIATPGGFQIFARIIKLYGKILDKLNSASAKPTVKEKIETMQEVITLAVPEKITTELTPDELNALKLRTYTIIFNTLTKEELDKAKTEKVLKELKDLVIKAAASSLIPEYVKQSLTNFAETQIIIEQPKEEKKEEEKKEETPKYVREPRAPKTRTTGTYQPSWQRGGQQQRTVIRRTGPPTTPAI